jgi:hypothetical protein
MVIPKNMIKELQVIKLLRALQNLLAKEAIAVDKYSKRFKR